MCHNEVIDLKIMESLKLDSLFGMAEVWLVMSSGMGHPYTR